MKNSREESSLVNMSRIIHKIEFPDFESFEGFQWVDHCLDSLEDFSNDSLKGVFYSIFSDHCLYNKSSSLPSLNPRIIGGYESVFSELRNRNIDIQPYFDFLFKNGDELIKSDVLLSENIVFFIGFDNFMTVFKDNANNDSLSIRNYQKSNFCKNLSSNQLIVFLDSVFSKDTEFKHMYFRYFEPAHYAVDYCLDNIYQIRFSMMMQSERIYSHLLNKFFDKDYYIDYISSNRLTGKSRIRTINRFEKLMSSHKDEENIKKFVCVITLKKWIHEILKTQNKEHLELLYNQQNVPYHPKYVEAQTTNSMNKMIKYSSHFDSAVRQCLANNENLPQDLQYKLATDTDELVRLSVIINPYVESEVLDLMYENENSISSTGMKNGSLATLLIAGHQNTSKKLLEEIACKHNLPDNVIVEALANPHQSTEFIDALYVKSVKNNDLMLLRKLALSPHLKYEQLLELTEYDDEEILFKALTHPNFPRSMKTLLLMND